MCLSLCSDDLFLGRPAPCDVDDQSCDECAQVEATVEAVGEACEVAVSVLAVVQRMEGPCQSRLQVAEHRVDPLELGQIAGLEATHDDRHVNAPCVGHRCETAQTIAGHDTARHQVGLRPLANRRQSEAADEIELQVHRMALLVERNGSHEWHLVLGATAGLAASALATEVGVIDLNLTTQAMGAFLLGHGVIDLLVQQPSRSVAHANLALERHRRQPGLGLADEVDGQEPSGQWQFGVLHQAAGGQRRLMTAGVALKEITCAVADNTVPGCAAARAAKAVRPARALDRLGALRFGAKDAEELGNRNALLKLDSVVGHGMRSVLTRPHATGSLAHRVSLAETSY